MYSASQLFDVEYHPEATERVYKSDTECESKGRSERGIITMEDLATVGSIVFSLYEGSKELSRLKKDLSKKK